MDTKITLCTLLIFLNFDLLAFRSPLKVVTLNIYRKPEFIFTKTKFGRQRVNQICKVLKQDSHPHNNGWDVVLIQEAWTTNSRRKLSKCGYKHIMNQSFDIDERFRNYPLPVKRFKKEAALDSGLLILSKYPIVKSYRMAFEERGRFWRFFRDGERIVRKSVYLAKIKISQHQFVWVTNTHLTANYCEPNQEDCVSYEDVRYSQLIQMRDWIKKMVPKGEPVILGGDLNMGPKEVSRDQAWVEINEILEGFTQGNYSDTVSTSSNENYFNDYNLGKLDHIFVSRELKIENTGLAFDQKIKVKGKLINYSDHFGWEGTVKLKGNNSLLLSRFPSN